MIARRQLSGVSAELANIPDGRRRTAVNYASTSDDVAFHRLRLVVENDRAVIAARRQGLHGLLRGPLSVPQPGAHGGSDHASKDAEGSFAHTCPPQTLKRKRGAIQAAIPPALGLH